jgi:hypothetical protein
MSSRKISALIINQLMRNLHSETGDEPVNYFDDIDSCYHDNGSLDWDRLEDFLGREDEEDTAKQHYLLTLMCLCASAKMESARSLNHKKAIKTPRVKKSRKRRPKYFVDPSTGKKRKLTPTLSLWWILYLQNPQPNCTRWSQAFRNRFRLPYQSYLDLLSMLKDEDDEGLFCRWTGWTDQHQRNCQALPLKVSPRELLLLGSLRYLGRGITFDDVEEATFISRHVHRDFFHKFVAFGASKLYSKYIQMPTSMEEIRECEHAYRIAGFPGCIGSTDATHIPLEKVSFKIRQSHLGFKMAATTRTYNLTVNHKRQILYTTTGHPGRWNDKTLARFDHFLDELRKGSFDEKITFDLLDKSGTKTIGMKGAYVIVDNGYLEWSSTIPPFKNSSSRSEIRFSQWLESLRKDVECTFGILKNRWRILKTGIRMHNTKVADNVWLMCCALHNMLLNVDGLSVGWQNGVPSYWQVKENGQFELSDMPRAIRRLISPSEVRDFLTMDRSLCGWRYHADNRVLEEEEVENDDAGVDQIRNDSIVVSFRFPSYHTGNFGACSFIISTPCTTEGGFLGQRGSQLHQETFRVRTSVVGAVID